MPREQDAPARPVDLGSPALGLVWVLFLDCSSWLLFAALADMPIGTITSAVAQTTNIKTRLPDLLIYPPDVTAAEVV